jgi:NAD+ kinase
VPTVGIVPRIQNPRLTNPDSERIARELCAWLSARGTGCLVEAESGIQGVPTAAGCDLAALSDLLVVLGGDGTLIHAAGLCGGREVPILGVNMGTLGFLTEIPRDLVIPMLEKALAGELLASRRLMLHAQVHRGSNIALEGSVLNDVVISKNALSRLARMEVRIDTREAAVYEADGLIVATPTGSTAYSLSAGGPIVYPTLEAILLTPICPHALTQRPVVLPADLPVRVRLASPGEMFVTLDGATGCPLDLGDEVVIRRAPHRTILLRNPDLDPFAILRQKLRWGAR